MEFRVSRRSLWLHSMLLSLVWSAGFAQRVPDGSDSTHGVGSDPTPRRPILPPAPDSTHDVGSGPAPQPAQPPRTTWQPEPLTILGVEIPVCEMLCGDRCFSLSGTCHCDAECKLYGDCCLDYFTHCLKSEDSNHVVPGSGSTGGNGNSSPGEESPGASQSRESDDTGSDFGGIQTSQSGESDDSGTTGVDTDTGSDSGGLETVGNNNYGDTGSESGGVATIGNNTFGGIGGVGAGNGIISGMDDDYFDEPEETVGEDDRLVGTERPPPPLQDALLDRLLAVLATAPLQYNEYLECREVGSRGLLMVTQCPSDLPPELDDTRGRCEDENPSLTLQDLIIVSELNVAKRPVALLYSNQHCATCHGVSLQSESVRLIAPEFDCGNNTAEAERLLEERDMEAFAAYLPIHCDPVYDFSQLWRFVCPQDFTYGHRCDPSFAGSNSSFLCGLYTHPVLDETSMVMYKNPHCAACSGVSNTSHLVCYESDYEGSGDIYEGGRGDIEKEMGTGADLRPKLPSFSLMMDFNGGIKGVSYEQRTVCPSGTYHNLGTDTCVTNSCGHGQLSLGGQCMQLNISVSTLLEPAELALTLVMVTDLPPGDIRWALSRSWANSKDVWVDWNCTGLSNFTRNWNVSGSAMSNGTCVVVELGLEDMLQDGLVFQTLVDEARQVYVELRDVYAVHLFNHNPNFLVSECPANSKATVSQAHVTEGNSPTGQLSLMVTDIGITLAFEESPSMMTWTTLASDEGVQFNELVFEAWTMFCEPSIVTCDKILVKSGEYEVEDSKVRVHGYEEVVSAEEYAVVGGDIVVCSSALPNGTLVVEDSSVEGVLSVVGISLSMVGLVFTVLTYSLFRVLRTVAGVGIMNLSVALFVAQLLFEVAPLASGHDGVCIGLGALEHYCWLVAFLWMNVLAYDIYRTFVDMSAQTQTTQSLRFRLFWVYAWGLPVVFVMTCLVLNLSFDVDFDYIDLDICWIKGGSPLLYVFGIPVALVIMMNIVFFTRTALALRAAMKIARRAKSEKESIARYAVYIKLSSLMGFTWIFGFISGLAEVESLSYLFIITNSVQGVYICVSFALSGRVRKMYKRMCGLEEESGSVKTSVSNFTASTAHQTKT